MRGLCKLEMKINYNISAKQQKRGLASYYARKFFLLFILSIVYLSISLCELLYGLFFDKASFNDIKTPFTIFILALAIYFLATYFYTRKSFSFVKKYYSKGYVEVVLYLVDKIVFYSVEIKSVTTYNYNDIKAAIETRHFIYITIFPNLLYILPKSLLSSNQISCLKKILIRNKVWVKFKGNKKS